MVKLNASGEEGEVVTYTEGELAAIGKAVIEKLPCVCNEKLCLDMECKHGCPRCWYLENIIDDLDLLDANI